MKLKLSKAPKTIAKFNRSTGKYERMTPKESSVSFSIGNGGGELIKIAR